MRWKSRRRGWRRGRRRRGGRREGSRSPRAGGGGPREPSRRLVVFEVGAREVSEGEGRRAPRDGARARAERLLEGVARVVETRGGARYVGEGALVASSSTPRPEGRGLARRGVSTPAASTRASVARSSSAADTIAGARGGDAREARPRHDTDPTRDGVRRRHHEYRALRQLRLAPLSSAWRFIRPRATTTRLVFVEPSEDWSARARGVDEVRGRRPTVACRRGEGICDICETLSPPISPFSPSPSLYLLAGALPAALHTLKSTTVRS